MLTIDLFFDRKTLANNYLFFTKYEMKVCSSNEGLTHETSAFNLTVAVWRVNSFDIHFVLKFLHSLTRSGDSQSYQITVNYAYT